VGGPLRFGFLDQSIWNNNLHSFHNYELNSSLTCRLTLKSRASTLSGFSNMTSGTPEGNTFRRHALLRVVLWPYTYESASRWSQGMASQRNTSLFQGSIMRKYLATTCNTVTHLSVMLTMSYHCRWMPLSRSFSNPGTHVLRNLAHICSGLMFVWPRFHWCWIEPASVGSRECRMCVCAYATRKFSVPRSLCVTHGAPSMDPLDRQGMR